MDKLRRVLSGREENEEVGLTAQVLDYVDVKRVFICSFSTSVIERPHRVCIVTFL